jgi:hypothetical protein
LVSISRKTKDDDKIDKKRNCSKNCSLFIVMIISIVVCTATPFLLFTYVGQNQLNSNSINKSIRETTMKNSSLLGITSTCKSSEFDCKAAGCTNPENKNCKVTCIPKFWVNNGREECADGSDEGTVGMKN